MKELTTNISWTVGQTPINYIIFWKSVIRTFRCIHVKFFNRLRFLDEVYCKKCTSLNNLRTITQEGNMEAREMTPFFSSPFSALTVCNSHFCISKYSKFIFMWSILFCRTPKFRQTLPIGTAYYSFLETKHPEFTKNSYYVLSLEGSQKKVSVYGL